MSEFHIGPKENLECLETRFIPASGYIDLTYLRIDKLGWIE